MTLNALKSSSNVPKIYRRVECSSKSHTKPDVPCTVRIFWTIDTSLNILSSVVFQVKWWDGDCPSLFRTWVCWFLVLGGGREIHSLWSVKDSDCSICKTSDCDTNFSDSRVCDSRDWEGSDDSSDSDSRISDSSIVTVVSLRIVEWQ